MTNSLHIFETMSSLTRQMAVAARDGNWDRLSELEREVALLRDRLISLEALDTPLREMEEESRARKAVLIQSMLADDREIRTYTEPWMASVRSLLMGNTRERNVRMAYTPPGQ